MHKKKKRTSERYEKVGFLMHRNESIKSFSTFYGIMFLFRTY